MSYTSKFTGEEIDNLLSNLNNGAMFELFNGRADVVNKEYPLSESIENFDILLVQGQHSTRADVTVLPIFVSTIKEDYDNTYAIDARAFTDKTMDTTAAAKIRIKFKDNKTFYPSLIAFSGWTISPAITKIVGIKFFSSTLGASTSNPIGSILPVMGTEAPQDYLICDGRELNINEYKELANYFETQFGNKNHFGGDGSTTFAVPDLRNEFLRGYGDRTNTIGIHQDATTHRSFRNNAEKVLIYANQADTHSPMNEDEAIKINTHTAQINVANWVTAEAGKAMNYTSRPTNVAVLFCIKYTENNTVSVKEKDYFHAYIEDNDGISASTNILINPSAGWIFDYNRGFEYDDAGNVLLKANKTYEVSFNIERAKFSGNTGTLDLVLAIEDTQFIVTSLNNLENGSWGQSGGGTRIITPKQDCYFTVKSTQWTGQTALYIANISIREI